MRRVLLILALLVLIPADLSATLGLVIAILQGAPFLLTGHHSTVLTIGGAMVAYQLVIGVVSIWLTVIVVRALRRPRRAVG